MEETDKSSRIIYTIGHSTHPFEEFITILTSFKIKKIIDIRSLPGSNRFPQFNKENLLVELPKNGIEYLHLFSLGGRRRVKKDSHNTHWRNASFRGYADYMETDEFKVAIDKLKILAQEKRVAIMCSEALWWRCHRSMISDYLKAKEWKVWHIMGVNTKKSHRFTSPARIENGEVYYCD